MSGRDVNERWATWLRQRMRRSGISTATELGRAAGVDQSVVSRWLNEGRTPKIDQLRKIATPLQATMSELLVAAGYLKSDELGEPGTASPEIADVAEAIRQDADLIEEARQHLLNQYALLLRLSEKAASSHLPAQAEHPAEALPRDEDMTEDQRQKMAGLRKDVRPRGSESEGAKGKRASR